MLGRLLRQNKYQHSLVKSPATLATESVKEKYNIVKGFFT